MEAGKKYYGRNVLLSGDRPGEEESELLQSHFQQFLQANQDMSRFVRQKKK